MTEAVISGNSAQAYASKLARTQVVAAYPITPQTTIIEKIADFVASGQMDAQYVKVESEHSAMAACISAAALGARTYTASSSQGLLLMHELLHWASGARAPIVMGITNRAVAPPLSIWTDHRDTISQRDTGWIQIYVESAQEVLDSVLVAFRVAEDPEVLLPAMVAEDGFYLSHTYEPVDIPSQEQVDRFLPPRRPTSGFRLGIANRYGTFTGPDLHMEFQRKVAEGMERVPRIFREAETEYERITGRNHGGPMPTYRTEDADAVLVTMGTATTTARSVVDVLRKHGKKVGLAKLRMFRPWPVPEVRALGADVDRIGVLDRSSTFGASGAAHTEFAAAMYGSPHRPLVRNFIAGLGGRDLTPATFTQMFESLLGTRKDDVEWLGLKRRAEVVVRG